MDTLELDSVTIGLWKEAYEAQVSRWVGGMFHSFHSKFFRPRSSYSDSPLWSF